MKKDILNWALKLAGDEVKEFLRERRKARVAYKTVTKKRDYR